jgi:hypothetical protein
MKNINIQISDTLHKELKLIATEEGTYLKSVIINALETYVNDKKEKKGSKPKRGTEMESNLSKEKQL